MKSHISQHPFGNPAQNRGWNLCDMIDVIHGYVVSRDPTQDGWIEKFIKRKWNSGLFLAVGAAEKRNPNCHKYATFEVGVFMFSLPKKHVKFFFEIF